MSHRIFWSIAAFVVLCAPLAASEPAKPKIALHVSKAITCAGDPIVNATILIADGKIQAIGPRDKIKVPAGYRSRRSQRQVRDARLHRRP